MPSSCIRDRRLGKSDRSRISETTKLVPMSQVWLCRIREVCPILYIQARTGRQRRDGSLSGFQIRRDTQQPKRVGTLGCIVPGSRLFNNPEVVLLRQFLNCRIQTTQTFSLSSDLQFSVG